MTQRSFQSTLFTWKFTRNHRTRRWSTYKLKMFNMFFSTTKTLRQLQSPLNLKLIKESLRRNPSEVQVTSGQKSSTKLISWHRIVNFCATVLNFFSREVISSNTKRRIRMWNFVWTEHLKVGTAEKKLMMKFCLCLSKFSGRWNLFSRVPVGKRLRCYFRQLFMYLAQRKCKEWPKQT